MSDSESSFTSTPPEIRQLAEGAAKELLPEKSKARYEAQYNTFKKWCSMKNVKVYSESVMLAYFTELVVKKTKSLWSIYSMLRACISLNNNLDISKYAKLISYLKRKSALHKPKKSKIFEENHISAFISQAPDDDFLLMKVVLIIGVCGACRREEIYKMVLSDLQVKDEFILFEIPKTKTNVSRSFAITKAEWVKIVKQYLHIRIKVDKIKDRLFLRYEKGKCCSAPIGINTIGSMPSKIANFLHLEDPKDYTGHCFRRSSATLLVNRGSDLLSLKRHGGWKSSSVAESYVQDSVKRRIEVAEMMTETEPQPSSSKRPNLSSSSLQVDVSNATNAQSNQVIPGGLFGNLENCSVNVNIYNNCTIVKDNKN